MRHHHKQHMPVPSQVRTGFVMTHAKMAFALFKALFNLPAHSSHAIQHFPRRILRGVTERVFNLAISVAANIEPYRFFRNHVVPVLSRTAAINTAHAFDIGNDRAFGAFRRDNALPGDAFICRVIRHLYRWNRGPRVLVSPAGRFRGRYFHLWHGGKNKLIAAYIGKVIAAFRQRFEKFSIAAECGVAADPFDGEVSRRDHLVKHLDSQFIFCLKDQVFRNRQSLRNSAYSSLNHFSGI